MAKWFDNLWSVSVSPSGKFLPLQATFQLKNIIKFVVYFIIDNICFRCGPKPKMPVKAINKTYGSEENSLLAKLSKDNNIILPSSLKQKYTVGRMIGDGKFFVQLY